MEYYISILIFTFGIITWIPFLKTPYGQDQAGAAYYVDQVIKGKLTLFKDVFAYPIGNYYHLIIIQYLFGKENKYYNRFMCLWCSLSACTIYWIVYDVFGLTSAIIAGILYALYIVNPRIDGNFGSNEAVLALPLLVSLFLVLQTSNSDSYFFIALSGLFFGYAILIRQTVILYLPGYFLMILGMNIPFTYCFIFVGSVFISNLIPLIYYWTKDAFWEYLACNWLVMLPSAINPKKYNRYYPKIFVRGEVSNKLKKQVLLRNTLSIFPLMFLTIISLISVIINYDYPLFHLGLFICLLSSIWMIFMRGTLFPHYWQYMIPWLVILSSKSVVETMSIFSIGATLNTFQLSIGLILVGMFVYTICVDYRFYIPHNDPYGYLRKFYGNSFVNSNYINLIRIAEHIKHTTKPEDKILVCGWAPYIVLYSERSSFTPDLCMYAEDYLEVYNKSNPTLLDFLNSIYRFKKFNIIKQKKNIFKSGFPEIIILSDGKGDIRDFEKLTNMCYAREEELGGYPLYRVDVELTKLMSFFENTKNESIQKTEEIDSNESELSHNLDPQDWDSALEIVKQLLKENPYKIEHLLILGECLIGSGNYSLLFRFYNRLI